MSNETSMDKLIITAAITGSRISREQTPFIPITPEEITQSAFECWEAGAAIAHIHVRNVKTGIGTQDLKLFRQVIEPLREKTDLLLCLTTSGIPGLNLPLTQRLQVLKLTPELASLDMGSINLGQSVFINSPEFLQIAATQMKEHDVKPELEIFDVGMIRTSLRMHQQGLLDDPLHYQFILGSPYGSPATPKALIHMQEMIPETATWSIVGIGRAHLPLSMLALVMGGHIRVGMEDNIYYQKGELVKRNAQFVERIIRIAQEYGRDIATPKDARRILHLPPN
jgi:3-keto-5-aminohexanoate cleavage enzyme